MELNGALSNPRLQVELSSLNALRGKLKRAPLPPAAVRAPLCARQGAVLQAVADVLRLAQKPMRARDVWRAVETAFGASLPKSSVYEALSTHAREGDLRFRRVAYGVYEYRKDL